MRSNATKHGQMKRTFADVDCPRVGPGRPSANFAGPGPGPQGPVHPRMALARGQHWPGPEGPGQVRVRSDPGPHLSLGTNPFFFQMQ